MFIPFESLPPSARVWIFQSDRPFSAQDLKLADERLRAFTEEWSVHGQPLNTSYRILYNRFIILAADEDTQTASGCSIDSSVRALKEIEDVLKVNLFDRNLVAFKQDEDLLVFPLQEIRQKFAEGYLNAETLTFNNLVNTRKQLENSWLVPAGQTWLKRYLPKPLAKVD